MEPKTIATLLAIFFTLAFIIHIIWFFSNAFFYSLGMRIENYRLLRIKDMPRGLEEKYHLTLNKNNVYYKSLPEHAKIKFLFRLERLIKDKHFSGREGLEVTEEMKILISAAAVQLTFGLEYYLIDYFDKIIVYPDIYESTITKEYHRGETQSGGVIVLSWKYFVEGYAIYDDKMNLGLHELAHALDLSRVLDNTDQSFFLLFNNWNLLVKDEIEKINSGENNFLRKYAGTNQREFFAVCVEYFFEAPDLFYKELPVIYKRLCNLLKQNPLDQQTADSWQILNTPDEGIIDEEPIFSSTVSLKYRGTVLILAILNFFAFFIMDADFPFLKFFGFLLLIQYLSLMITTYKKIEIKGSYLFIDKSVLNKKQYSFSLENIMSISFETKNINGLSILYLNQGKVENFFTIIKLSNEEKETFSSIIRKNNIVL